MRKREDGKAARWGTRRVLGGLALPRLGMSALAGWQGALLTITRVTPEWAHGYTIQSIRKFAMRAAWRAAWRAPPQ